MNWEPLSSNITIGFTIIKISSLDHFLALQHWMGYMFEVPQQLVIKIC